MVEKKSQKFEFLISGANFSTQIKITCRIILFGYCIWYIDAQM